MKKYVIHGGRPLYGKVNISGAKNAAVAIIPAALLVEGACRIENIPQISDTDTLLRILTYMGAKVRILDQTAIIEGVPELYGAPVTATDLRAGAALVVAGLMAKGVTEIYEPAFIARGYEHIEDKLQALGAKIHREDL